MPLFSAGTSPSSGTYVTSLVAAVAATRPSHPAVVADRSILTYGQLEAQSSAFARELQRSGVLRKSLIGLVADRSVSHIVGALGILKCGAAYLPLDSGDPERRLRMQVEDSEPNRHDRTGGASTSIFAIASRPVGIRCVRFGRNGDRASVS